MYYDRLKQRVRDYSKARQAADLPRVSVLDCVAPCYYDIHSDVVTGTHTIFHLPGGRGSGKSSFVSLEIVDGMMNDPNANAIVFRRTANTMRESVFSQIAWAIDELNVSHLWRGSVSPLAYTFIPTGQQIVFRGLDDAGKLKSIKPRHGIFKFVWFEEFSELTGANMVRSVMQSVVRGGTDFRIFNSFNPPLSVNSWANKYILIPDERAVVFRTTYKDIPPEWLGENFIEEAERLEKINPQAYRHEYMGEPTGTGGEVFPNIEARTITDDEINGLQYVYEGLDWGFSVDPFAFLRLAYDRKTETIYFIDELYKKGCSNTQIAEMIKEKGYDKALNGNNYYSPFGGTYIEEKQTIVADSAEPKSISDLCKQGLKVIPCKKYPGSVIYGIRWLQSRHIVIDPARTPNAWREFSEYEYMTTKDGEFLADVPDANNHLVDCCRYACDRLINSAKYSA
jgi:PBSX family phage terminase large subunit